MESAATKALRVKSPNDGGESINIKSYLSFIDSRAFLSLVSLDRTPTSSISAPVKLILQGMMFKLLKPVLIKALVDCDAVNEDII